MLENNLNLFVINLNLFVIKWLLLVKLKHIDLKICASGESNPGQYRGRVLWYHYTRWMFFNPLINLYNFILLQNTWKIPLPGIEPGSPGWKPDILTAGRQRRSCLRIVTVDLIYAPLSLFGTKSHVASTFTFS